MKTLTCYQTVRSREGQLNILSNIWPLVTLTVNIIGPLSSLAEYGGLIKPTVTSVWGNYSTV